VLGGRESVAAWEELVVRARGDLDAGRLGAAALGLHAALRALAASGADVGAAAEAAAAGEREVLAGREPDRAGIEAALRDAEREIRSRARG
jgi:hypothetical protein